MVDELPLRKVMYPTFWFWPAAQVPTCHSMTYKWPMSLWRSGGYPRGAHGWDFYDDFGMNDEVTAHEEVESMRVKMAPEQEQWKELSQDTYQGAGWTEKQCAFHCCEEFVEKLRMEEELAAAI